MASLNAFVQEARIQVFLRNIEGELETSLMIIPVSNSIGRPMENDALFLQGLPGTIDPSLFKVSTPSLLVSYFQVEFLAQADRWEGKQFNVFKGKEYLVPIAIAFVVELGISHGLCLFSCSISSLTLCFFSLLKKN